MTDALIPDHAWPVAAPPRVRDLLAAATDGPVEILHRGPHAVYVEVAGRAVGVLTSSAVKVPIGLRSTIAEFFPNQGISAYLESGILHIDSRPLSVRRAVDVHIPRLRYAGAHCNTANSVTFAATPPAAVAEFVVCTTPHGIDAAAVSRLVGHGDGLTPLGDDVLCGWLAAQRALGMPTTEVDDAVRAHLPRTTLVSASLLDCALLGEGVPQLTAWLHALGRTDEVDRADDLLAVGSSSGAGLMAGAQLAISTVRASQAVAA